MGNPGVTAAAVFLLAAAVGCGSSAASADAGGSHPHDGSLDQTLAIEKRPDAAADGSSRTDAAPACCTMEGTVLHMSWACYCQAYGCPTVSPNCGPLFTWTSSCGLLVGTWTTAGGANKRAFDTKGAVVGVRLSSGEAEYGCGGDHTGTATTIQAGQLPADSCSAVACSCNLDGTVDCSTPDAAL